MSQVLERPSPTQQYTIRPLGAALGAEVLGLDLAQPVGAGLIQLMKEALNQYGVLCFRKQNLTEPQQIAFSELWGRWRISRKRTRPLRPPRSTTWPMFRPKVSTCRKPTTA